MQKIRRNDKVKIMVGKDEGKEGKVLKVLRDKGKVIIEGVELVKKHVKPGTRSKEGGIINIERPIDVSNVMMICQKCNRPVRVKVSAVKNRKHRICGRCGDYLDKK